MKNLLTVILLCCCTSGYSQLREGSFSLTGSSRLNSSDDQIEYTYLPYNTFESYTEYKYRNLNINVGINYFLKRNISAGLQMGLNYSNYTRLEIRTNDTGYLTDYSLSFPITLVFSFYHPVKRNFYLMNQIVLGTTYNQKVRNATDYNLSGNAYNAGYNFGFMWFPGKRIGISMALGGFGFHHYRYKKAVVFDDETIRGVSAFNTSLNSANIILGVNYFFNP